MINWAVKIKKLYADAFIPEKINEHSAAYDLRVPRDYEVTFGRQIIPLGIALEMPIQISADIRPRSGYSAKGMKVYQTLPNGKEEELRIEADVILGLIDSDYRGEIGIILNVTDERLRFNPLSYIIKRGEAPAQLSFRDVPTTTLEIAEKLTSTKRGDKGFGKMNNE